MSTDTYTPNPYVSDDENIDDELETDAEDAIEDVDFVDEDSDDESDSSSSDVDESAGPAQSSAKPSRALIRRVAHKATDVINADEETVLLVSHLLGSAPDPVALTTAIMTSNPVSTLRPVQDFKSLRELDPLEAGIQAATMPRAKMRALWGLLHELGVSGTSAALPASDAKAAMSLVKKLTETTSDQVAKLDAAAALMRRG